MNIKTNKIDHVENSHNPLPKSYDRVLTDRVPSKRDSLLLSYKAEVWPLAFRETGGCKPLFLCHIPLGTLIFVFPTTLWLVPPGSLSVSVTQLHLFPWLVSLERRVELLGHHPQGAGTALSPEATGTGTCPGLPPCGDPSLSLLPAGAEHPAPQHRRASTPCPWRSEGAGGKLVVT